MTKTVPLLVAVCSFTLHANAEDSALKRRMTPAVRAVANAAERAEHGRLLIVVRTAKGVKAPPALLPELRSAVKKILQAEGLTIIESADAIDQLGTECEKMLIDPEQVADLQQETEFDALVTVDFQRVGKRTIVRIALIDEERRLIVRTVRLRLPPMPTTFPPLKPPVKKTTPGLGAANAGSSIPPLAKGPSGFRKGGNGRPAPRPRPRRRPSENDATDESEPVGGQQKVSAVNRSIVRFAVGQLGKQVGNGECWTLAAEALEAAGAQPPQLYDFGTEIKQNQIQPGDILQFTSARFDLPGGGYVIMGAPDHTAVVYALNGDQIFVLHQNFGQKIVTILDIRFAEMTSGEVQAYRAVAGK